MNFTDISIKNLRPKARRYVIWQDNGNSFGVRVSPKGRKSFITVYRYKGKQHLITHGIYPKISLAQAKRAHAETLARVDKGIDPGKKRYEAKTAPTVEELADEYLRKWAIPRKRTWKNDEYILVRIVLPVWGKSKAKDITRRDVNILLDSIMDRGSPIMANRTLAIIRKMFNFAVSQDILEIAPTTSVKAPAPEKRRDRVLTESEIKAFWLELDKLKPLMRGAFQFLLLTAQRSGELTGAEWIDIHGDWWIIPGSKTKNGSSHRVPLSSPVMSILTQLDLNDGRLFPIQTRSLSRVLRQHQMDFSPHDLRRTAASHMTSLGVPRLTVAKILNHVETGVTAVYDRHSYDTEKRQALELWGQRVMEIVK